MTEFVGLVGHRAGNVVVGFGYRQPREVLPDAFRFLKLEGLVVNRTQKGVLGIVESVVVVDEISGLEALKFVGH